MSAPPNTNAKRGFCPDCGGPGTYVLPSFITCDSRCGFSDSTSDGTPEYVDPERTTVMCRLCGADADQVKKWGPEFRVGGQDFWTCRKCGKSFHA